MVLFNSQGILPDSSPQTGIILEIDDDVEYSYLYEINNWKLVNALGNDYILPGDPLEYQFNIQSNLNEDSTVQYFFKSYNKQQMEFQQNGTWYLNSNEKHSRNFSFFVNEDGTYRLELDLIFKYLNGTIYRHKHHESIAQSISLGDKLQIDSNNLTGYGVIAASIIGAATATALFTNIYHSKEHVSAIKRQNRLMFDANVLATRESQANFKADLRVTLTSSRNLPKKHGEKNVQLHLGFDIKNHGAETASFVIAHYGVYDQPFDELSDIEKEEKTMNKNPIPNIGDIQSMDSRHFDIHVDDLSEVKPRYVVLRLEYGYHEFEDSKIYQIHVRGGENQHSIHSTFSNND